MNMKTLTLVILLAITVSLSGCVGYAERVASREGSVGSDGKMIMARYRVEYHRGPGDTPQKIDSAGQPNFGPAKPAPTPQPSGFNTWR